MILKCVFPFNVKQKKYKMLCILYFVFFPANKLFSYLIVDFVGVVVVVVEIAVVVVAVVVAVVVVLLVFVVILLVFVVVVDFVVFAVVVAAVVVLVVVAVVVLVVVAVPLDRRSELRTEKIDLPTESTLFQTFQIDCRSIHKRQFVTKQKTIANNNYSFFILKNTDKQ
jgi:hypothetical protein